MSRIAIVGASLAGLEAAKELRRAGFDGDLTVFGREAHAPYDRPPLSKELLAGTYQRDQVGLALEESASAQWRLGTTVTRLDAAERTLEIDGGRPEPFDGIVIATGADPIRPRFRHEADRPLEGIHVVRTLDDCLALSAELRHAPVRVLIVGAGFIGAEVASTCRRLGLRVTVVEGLAVPMQLALGHQVGEVMGEIQRDNGVDLRTGVTVTDLRGGRRVEEAHLSDGTVLAADVVVLAVGVRPATRWLEGSGLTLDGGVVCDETCLAAPGIVAAGDVARWPNNRFGEVRRVEHWDNAIRQAHHAARRLLAGSDAEAVAYEPVPWFWSDQFDRKLQLVGSPLSFDEFRVVSGSLAERKFAGVYRRDDRLIATVALNSPRVIVSSRRLLERNPTWTEALAVLGAATDARPR